MILRAMQNQEPADRLSFQSDRLRGESVEQESHRAVSCSLARGRSRAFRAVHSAGPAHGRDFQEENAVVIEIHPN